MPVTGRKKGTPKTGGRRKGVPNKMTVAIRDAVLSAATEVGGGGPDGLHKFLVAQAQKENNASYMGLLNKIMPTQITPEAEDEDQQLVVILKTTYEDADKGIPPTPYMPPMRQPIVKI
jgi:hypothetical protein